MSDTFDDDTGRASTQGPPLHYSPHLLVLLECDRPLSGSTRHSLHCVERVLLGRGPERSAGRTNLGGVQTLDISLPGRSVSAAHAQLLRVGASWLIEDRGSKNGTFVNGERVERAILHPEDLIEIGHVFLRVHPSLATAADAQLDLDLAGASTEFPVTLDCSFGTRLDALASLAASDLPVLLLGESGVGKEVVARGLHRIAGRPGKFVAVNCGAIPDALVASHLFGHSRGAFSGAVRDESGFVRAADCGTLLLDEIADLPGTSQAALLRVLQEREVVPVGSAQPVRVDVRFIGATHRILEDMVARGAFRRDLYARLAGATLKIPPLRQRRDDVGLLIAAILGRRVQSPRTKSLVLAKDVGLCLLRYDWPYNVRELEQCLAHAAALASNGCIQLEHLPSSVARTLDSPVPVRDAPQPGDLTERDLRLRLALLRELASHSGNLSQVARAMGKERVQIRRWCRRFGINPSLYRR